MSRRRFDAATLVFVCFVFLSCTSATSTTKQTDLRSFVARAAVAKDGVVVNDLLPPPPPRVNVLVDVTNVPLPAHGTSTTANEAGSGPHTDGPSGGTSSGGGGSGPFVLPPLRPQPSVAVSAKGRGKRKRRVVEEHDDDAEDENVVASSSTLERAPLGGLKPGFYCQGRPNNSAQCLNAQGKPKQACYGYDSKKTLFCTVLAECCECDN